MNSNSRNTWHQHIIIVIIWFSLSSGLSQDLQAELEHVQEVSQWVIDAQLWIDHALVLDHQLQIAFRTYNTAGEQLLISQLPADRVIELQRLYSQSYALYGQWQWVRSDLDTSTTSSDQAYLGYFDLLLNSQLYAVQHLASVFEVLMTNGELSTEDYQSLKENYLIWQAMSRLIILQLQEYTPRDPPIEEVF